MLQQTGVRCAEGNRQSGLLDITVIRYFRLHKTDNSEVVVMR